MKCFVIYIILFVYQISHPAAAHFYDQPDQSKKSFTTISAPDRATVLCEIGKIQKRFKQDIEIRRSNKLSIPRGARQIALNCPDQFVQKPYGPHAPYTSFAQDVDFIENCASFIRINDVLNKYSLSVRTLNKLFIDNAISSPVWTYQTLKGLKALMLCTSVLQEKLYAVMPHLEDIYSLCTPELINKPDAKGKTPLYLAIENWRGTDLYLFVHLLAQGADLHTAPKKYPNRTPFMIMQQLDERFAPEERLAGFHMWTLERRKIAFIWSLFLHTNRKRQGESSYWEYELTKGQYPWTYGIIKSWIDNKYPDKPKRYGYMLS